MVSTRGQKGEGWAVVVVILAKLVSSRLPAKVTHEQASEGEREMRHGDFRRKKMQGGGSSKCKGPAAGVCYSKKTESLGGARGESWEVRMEKQQPARVGAIGSHSKGEFPVWSAVCYIPSCK